MRKIHNFQFSIFNSRGFIQHHFLVDKKTKEKRFKSGAGFTLVELLIVIAIIGVLSTLLMANFLGVRERSRDAQRKSNLRQIQSALELYRADIGSYPSSLKNCPTSAPTDLGNASATTNPCGTIYMKKVPNDPSFGQSGAYYGGVYYYGAIGTGYNLVACLENVNDKDISTTLPSGSAAPQINCGNSPSFRYYVLTDL